jgi:integrase
VLGGAELTAIWKACKDDDYGRIVRLLILLGCRRQEIGSLLWREVDVENGTLTISAERAKNHRALTLPLPSIAVELLRAVPPRNEHVFGRSRRGFGSWSDLKTALDTRSKVSGWTLHDIRRSVATGMNELGIAPHVVEQILNHQSGHKRRRRHLQPIELPAREGRAGDRADHARALPRAARARSCRYALELIAKRLHGAGNTGPTLTTSNGLGPCHGYRQVYTNLGLQMGCGGHRTAISAGVVRRSVAADAR